MCSFLHSLATFAHSVFFFWDLNTNLARIKLNRPFVWTFASYNNRTAMRKVLKSMQIKFLYLLFPHRRIICYFCSHCHAHTSMKLPHTPWVGGAQTYWIRKLAAGIFALVSILVTEGSITERSASNFLKDNFDMVVSATWHGNILLLFMSRDIITFICCFCHVTCQHITCFFYVCMYVCMTYLFIINYLLPSFTLKYSIYWDCTTF